MRRNIDEIGILLALIEFKYDTDQGLVLDDDYFETHPHDAQMLPMLLDSGFIEQLPGHPEGIRPSYRLKWKGHCFLDLHDTVRRYGEEDRDSLEYKIGRLFLNSLR